MASLVRSIKPRKDNDDFTPSPELKGKFLWVRVWGGSRSQIKNDGDNGNSVIIPHPHLLAKPKKIPYGKPEVVFKIGGKERLYRINYNTEGMIKQEGKRLYYDTYFNNTVGGLRLYEYPEDMDAEETYTAFKNNGVRMYVEKGGIKMIVLIIVAIFGMVGLVGLVIMAPYTANANAQHDTDQKNLIGLSSKIDQLRAQIQNMGAKPIA